MGYYRKQGHIHTLQREKADSIVVVITTYTSQETRMWLINI